jgi:hypothetical protein
MDHELPWKMAPLPIGLKKRIFVNAQHINFKKKSSTQRNPSLSSLFVIKLVEIDLKGTRINLFLQSLYKIGLVGIQQL